MLCLIESVKKMNDIAFLCQKLNAQEAHWQTPMANAELQSLLRH